MTFPENEYLAYRIVQFLVSHSQHFIADYGADCYNVAEWLDMCFGL